MYVYILLEVVGWNGLLKSSKLFLAILDPVKSMLVNLQSLMGYLCCNY
jgi:hypothetical protein